MNHIQAPVGGAFLAFTIVNLTLSYLIIPLCIRSRVKYMTEKGMFFQYIFLPVRLWHFGKKSRISPSDSFHKGYLALWIICLAAGLQAFYATCIIWPDCLFPSMPWLGCVFRIFLWIAAIRTACFGFRGITQRPIGYLVKHGKGNPKETIRWLWIGNPELF